MIRIDAHTITCITAILVCRNTRNGDVSGIRNRNACFLEPDGAVFVRSGIARLIWRIGFYRTQSGDCAAAMVNWKG